MAIFQAMREERELISSPGLPICFIFSYHKCTAIWLLFLCLPEIIRMFELYVHYVTGQTRTLDLGANWGFPDGYTGFPSWRAGERGVKRDNPKYWWLGIRPVYTEPNQLPNSNEGTFHDVQEESKQKTEAGSKKENKWCRSWCNRFSANFMLPEHTGW